MRYSVALLPALMLMAGTTVLSLRPESRPMKLRAALHDFPFDFLGLSGTDRPITPQEVAVSGVSSYLNRTYGTAARPSFALYVGYFDSQGEGRQLHSPRNCLPGAGWDVLSAETVSVRGHELNRYTIRKGPAQALVYYWYQGRGRITSDEFAVRFQLFRDAAIIGRTDEALVRIVVPIVSTQGTESQAAMHEGIRLAETVASEVIPMLSQFLPAPP